jgi:hypothetical protein
VQSWETVRDAVDEIVTDFNGRLDIFVANSGIAWEDGPLLDGPVDKIQQVLTVNVDGTFFCARAAALHWRRQKKEGTTFDGKKLDNFTYGSFIATASMSGHVVNVPRLQAAYNASKAAVIHACEYIPYLHTNPCTIVRRVIRPVANLGRPPTFVYGRQVLCDRVGRLRPRQQREPGLYQDGDGADLR